MKTYLLVALAACSILAAGVPTAEAASKKSKMTQAEMNEMCKDREMCKMMMKGMMANKETKMWMAKQLKADAEFREMFGNVTTGGG